MNPGIVGFDEIKEIVAFDIGILILSTKIDCKEVFRIVLDRLTFSVKFIGFEVFIIIGGKVESLKYGLS